MQDLKSLTHSAGDYRYHVIWIPKCRRKVLYESLRQYPGEIFHELAGQKESKILEAYMCTGRIHILIRIPPKYEVAYISGYMKGKSAIKIARNYMGRHTATGQQFWARGYYVPAVGGNEEVIRKYIREQEKEDRRLEQLALFKDG
jgi:putative transposase